MARRKAGALLMAGVLALSIPLTGCGAKDDVAAVDESNVKWDANGEMSMRGCTPQNSLLGSNTGETCGGTVLAVTNAQLIRYNPTTADPEMEIAQSITPNADNTKFTVKMNSGWTFHDGTPITAKSFVDAWNWAAYGPNGQKNSYFFSVIKGYNDLQCDAKADPSCKPKAEKLTGLAVVDDSIFTIETSEPVSNLPVRLGYNAFAPMPDAFFKDTDPKKANFVKLPVGSGPFKITRNDEKEITLERFDAFKGSDKAQVKTIHYKIYQDSGAAYTDVIASNLDLTDSIAPDQLINDQWKKDLEGRALLAPTSSMAYLGFSPADEQLKNPKVRQAISMAIDREAITKEIFQGARTPATSWVAPTVSGYNKDACGEACKFDKEKAKKTLAEAGGYTGTLELWVNADAPHKLWADAVCNSIKTNVGIECVTQQKPKFSALLNDLTDRKLKGMTRYGWQMDYPSIENYLAPIYGKGADSNYWDYNNPKFDAKLAEAAAAKDNASANKLYQEAEKMIAADLPTVPLWVTQTSVGWSKNVGNVKVTPFGTVDLTQIKVKAK